jgi:hypothetical protein
LNQPQLHQSKPVDPYAAWSWPRYFEHAPEMPLEEHFEKDKYPWRIEYVEIALQIGADEDIVKVRCSGPFKLTQARLMFLQDWFIRRRLASRGSFLDQNRHIQQCLNFYDVRLSIQGSRIGKITDFLVTSCPDRSSTLGIVSQRPVTSYTH